MAKSSYNLSVTLDSLRNPTTTDLLAAKKRLISFEDWPYDKNQANKCTSYALAINGFKMTSNDEGAPSAMCICCQKDLIWEPNDDAKAEHLRSSPNCALALILNGKTEADLTLRDSLTIVVMRENVIALKSVFEKDKDNVRKCNDYNNKLYKKALEQFNKK
uniref:Baculoviral IAP repeat-containing protein 5 n=1 Tax=Rhabditophanes sp. KR3021 TaxID=114890 RepID=A0AC35TZ48_9BILA